MGIQHRFGAVVRRRRRAADLTQEDLAAAANLHPTYISLLERGERTPTLEVVRRLAAALGTSMADLVAETEGADPPASRERSSG